MHDLRSLWGAVAAYFFCPQHHHEYAFLQHYLGHVLDSGATGNYFRYQLVDDRGHPLGDKGILLDRVGALPLMEEESGNTAAPSPQPLPLLELLDGSEAMENAKQKPSKPKEPKRAIASRQETAAVSQQDLAELQKAWQLELERARAALRSEFEAQIQAVRIETNGGWFVRRVEGLERENLDLRRERDRAIAQAQESQSYREKLAQLQVENAALAQTLKLAQDKLEGFRLLLDGTETIATERASEDASTQELPPIPSEQLDAPPIAAAPLEPVATQQAEPSQPARPTTPQASADLPKARGPKAGKAFQRAEAIVLAIQDWNRLHPSESFAINGGILENVFRIHRQAVKEFFNTYQNELWDYHQEIGVESPRWHNRGKDTQKLKAFVTQRLQG
ncbi:protelomerase family protein [Altericista sp. CCNU0014]